MIILEANHLQKTVRDRVLFSVDQLRIKTRDRIALVGRNGSGKTTLLNILAGLEEADHGTITSSASRYVLPQLKEVQANKSGGEIAIQTITQAFALNPDILFADEPTTHLDWANVKELETQLKAFPGAIILISHDRSMLDALCTTIWEIDDGTVTEYHGHYSNYLKQKKQKREQHQQAYEKYVGKKKQLERARRMKEQKAKTMIKPPSKKMSTSESRIWKMQHATKQKKMHQSIKALETRMEKMEQVKKPKTWPAVKMDVPHQNNLKGRTIICGKNLSMTVGEQSLWEEASFCIKGGEKVAIIGNNGVGKTTLLRQMLNRSTEITCSPAVTFGYFSQQLDILANEKSILENVKVQSIFPEETIRTVLARLHFIQDDVFKPIHVLSGGERVKVAFAKVFLSEMNVLVMDEPTNYLDTEAIEALEHLLQEYEGTVIFVSHDRRFIEKVATKMIDIKEQSLTVFDGGYQEYQESLQTPCLRDLMQDKRLQVETRLTEVIAKLSTDPSEKWEQEFEQLVAERRRLNVIEKKE